MSSFLCGIALNFSLNCTTTVTSVHFSPRKLRISVNIPRKAHDVLLRTIIYAHQQTYISLCISFCKISIGFQLLQPNEPFILPGAGQSEFNAPYPCSRRLIQQERIPFRTFAAVSIRTRSFSRSESDSFLSHYTIYHCIFRYLCKHHQKLCSQKLSYAALRAAFAADPTDFRRDHPQDGMDCCAAREFPPLRQALRISDGYPV